MSTTKILITGKLHDVALEKFKSNPKFELTYIPDGRWEEYEKYLPSCQVLVTRSETNIDKKLIDAAGQLKVIARAAVGVGNIDIEYATERGILVINTPGKNTNSAAELTLGLLLSALRNLPQAHAHMKSGGWDRHRFTGEELKGKKVGIVGLGNVGHRVAKFARGFDAQVYAYDPYISPQVFKRHDVEPIRDLVKLAEMVDILTVHVPKNKETTGMISEEVLQALGPKGIFINAARGGICEENLLLRALNESWIDRAALDTFDHEPEPKADLVAHDRVWVSPHIGASTEQAQFAIAEAIYEQVLKAVDGLVVDYHVNLPEVGVIDKPVLKAYSSLAEKLGSIVGQILEFNPSKVSFQYRGDLADLDNSIVRLSWMKGYLSHVVDDYVSFVNATRHFERLGLEVEEKVDPGFDSYRSAIKVVVQGKRGEQLTIGGVVFEDRYARLTLLQDFYFELEPTGSMLLLQNDDRPGVIGNVGKYLADNQINISSFNLSRNRLGGNALAMLSIDSELSAQQLKQLAQIEHVLSARAIRL